MDGLQICQKMNYLHMQVSPIWWLSNELLSPYQLSRHSFIATTCSKGWFIAISFLKFEFPANFFHQPWSHHRIYDVYNRKYLVKMQMLIWEFIRKVIYPLIYPITLWSIWNLHIFFYLKQHSFPVMIDSEKFYLVPIYWIL